MLASSVAWVQHLQTMVLFSRVLYSPSPVFGRSEALHILQIFYVCIFAGYDAFQMCGLAMKDEPPRHMDLVRRSEVLSLVVRAGAAIFRSVHDCHEGSIRRRYTRLTAPTSCLSVGTAVCGAWSVLSTARSGRMQITLCPSIFSSP